MITPRLPSVPPGDFPARRWDQLRRDAADFLASPWAMEAARFGWTDLDLFGVDADRPYTRIDGLGLVLALDARSAYSPSRAQTLINHSLISAVMKRDLSVLLD